MNAFHYYFKEIALVAIENKSTVNESFLAAQCKLHERPTSTITEVLCTFKLMVTCGIKLTTSEKHNDVIFIQSLTVKQLQYYRFALRHMFI